MARSAFVRAQRPGRSGEVEIVVGLALAAGGRIADRQHELTLLAGIADQRRRLHVRRRLRGRFGFGRQAHHHRPLGQRDHAFLRDRRFQRRVDVLVARFELLVRDRVLLQLADHVAIIGRVQALGLRHHRRQRLHGRARLHVFELGAFDQRARVDVDADALEAIGVELRRQAEIVAGARKHLGVHPRHVIVELLFHGIQGRLAALDAVFGEQFANALDVGRHVRQRLRDAAFHRAEQARRRQFLLVTRLGLFEDRGAARVNAGVALQQFQRLAAPGLGNLLVEQGLDIAEDELRHVEPGQVVLLAQAGADDIVLDRGNEDLQVLPDIAVLFRGQLLPQLRQQFFRGGDRARIDVGADVDGEAVVLAEAGPRGAFGFEDGLRLQHFKGVGIAGGHPGFFGGRGRRGDGGCAHGAEGQRDQIRFHEIPRWTRPRR